MVLRGLGNAAGDAAEQLMQPYEPAEDGTDGECIGAGELLRRFVISRRATEITQTVAQRLVGTHDLVLSG